MKTTSLLNILRLLASTGGKCPGCSRFAPRGCLECARVPLLQGEVDGLTALHVAAHRGSIATQLLQLKYGETPALAFGLGHLAGRKLARLSPCAALQHPVFIPVPLHEARLLERGYNQAALLARGIVSGLGSGRVETRALHRLRETERQASLNEEQRVANLEDAFYSELRGLRTPIWLVDDVCTTGSTLSGCARALLRCNVSVTAVITITCSLTRATRTRACEGGLTGVPKS